MSSAYNEQPFRERRRQASETGVLSRERIVAFSLLAATLVALFLCVKLVQPFLPALAWALALAIVAHPVHVRMRRRIKNESLAAALTVLLVALTIVGPALLVTNRLIKEVRSGVEWIAQAVGAGGLHNALASNARARAALSWLESQSNLREQIQAAAGNLASHLSSAVTGSVWAIAHLVITLFILFYFFRDRRAIIEGLRCFVPLSNRETDEVFARVTDTVAATIYGTFTVALIQGTLGGLMFWLLGLPAPLFWGIVMAMVSVVPVLGSFVVWVPAAMLLALQGHWGKALILVVWGTVLIGMIDNIIYPMLVGKRLQLNPLIIFIAAVGGISLFGASGLILGPVIVVVTIALIDIWRRRTRNGHTADTAAVDAA